MDLQKSKGAELVSTNYANWQVKKDIHKGFNHSENLGFLSMFFIRIIYFSLN